MSNSIFPNPMKSNKADANLPWKWKGYSFNKQDEETHFPSAKYFRETRWKVEENVLGPGGGAGIGCGVGVGLGLVGGAGFSGWLSPSSHLRLVFGAGFGCGIGFGFGFGQGFGYGVSLHDLLSGFSEKKRSDLKSRGLIEI